MSHILHFYHLVALDYVDVNGTGLIPKGPACPNYSNSYYARGIDPTGTPPPNNGAVYTVNNLGGVGGIQTAPPPPAHPVGYLGDLTPYLAGQYVRALKFRRMCQQLGAMFSGKMPNASCYTPGCVTTKTYNPNPAGPDAAIVQKFEEIMWGGPNHNPVAPPGNHPLNGTPLTQYNPHPESVLGFIGRPSNFWTWALNGFNPAHLPLWAKAGVLAAGGAWKEYTGTYLFDVVAAAHIFPEYFWIGTGYGRFLAWGAYEKGGDEGGPYVYPDKRLIHRSRVHIPQVPLGPPPPLGSFYMTFPAAYPVKDPGGVFRINEFTAYSWYNDAAGINKGRHPYQGVTNPNPDKAGGYTYAKSPRFLNNESLVGAEQAAHPNVQFLPYEVGPLARMMANAFGLPIGPGIPIPAPILAAVDNGDRMAYYPGILNDVDKALVPPNGIGIFPAWGATPPLPGTYANVLYGNIPNLAAYPSNYIGDGTLDRIAARALECYYVARHLAKWFSALNPAEDLPGKDYSCVTKTFTWGGHTRKVPKLSSGYGMTEAPRGALGHWIKIGKKGQAAWNGKTSRYQIITPTAWNVSPKDTTALQQHGPIEKAIIGTPVLNNNEPVEIMRVVHSFDCCLACTVHLLEHKDGEKVKVSETQGRTTP
jgi:Ni,Fe-hydrogenase I large subunit